MPVIDVKEDWREGDAGFDPEDGQSRRGFTVLFDEADEPKNRPGLACFATGIPRMYEWHPFTPWLWVCNIQTRAIGPLLYEVEVSYKIGSAGSWQGQEDPLTSPLDEPPKRSWSFATSEEQQDKDIKGNPIQNSADEPFDPPITIQVYDLTYRVVRNEESFDALTAASYIGTVNGDYFGGFEPGTVKCTDISSDEVRIGQFTFYQVTYEFVLRTDGWTRRILDQGYREKGELDDNGVRQYTPITDDGKSTGTPLSEPVMLDGYGNRLKEGEAPIYRSFNLYKEMSFSALGL